MVAFGFFSFCSFIVSEQPILFFFSIDFVCSQIYCSFLMYSVRFLCVWSFKKIAPSVKSFVQKIAPSIKSFVQTNCFFKFDWTIYIARFFRLFYKWLFFISLNDPSRSFFPEQHHHSQKFCYFSKKFVRNNSCHCLSL